MGLQIPEREKKILAVLQDGFPRSQTPYADIAEKVGITTKQLLDILEDWKCQGKLRRVGSIVDHFKVGLSGAAMVAWQVEPERVEQAGKILAVFKEVSHAYERHTNQSWPYNVYTMVHGADIKEVELTVERMSRACKVSMYRILATEKELKKVPPTYITESRVDDTKEEE
jgi:DNA-binding Lrp family transcriptional regulator